VASGDHYRSLSSRFSARAQAEHNLNFRAQWNYLATCYLRLAEQADRNQLTDIVYEPPLQGGNASPANSPPTSPPGDEQSKP
jgi:hypothetical protein